MHTLLVATPCVSLSRTASSGPSSGFPHPLPLAAGHTLGIDMGRTVEKTRAGGQWSEAKFWSFVRSNLRKASLKWPPRQQAMAAARRALTKPVGRRKWEYLCAGCHEWCEGKHVQVDHKIPCGSLNCAEDLPGFVTRLFCEVEDFQLICDACHYVKTGKERRKRATSKKKKPAKKTRRRKGLTESRRIPNLPH